MSKLSQVDKIIKFLKDNPNKHFTTREIAKEIVSLYPKDYEQKRKNPRFEDEKEFLAQVIREVGASKNQILKSNPHMFVREKPRPMVYWFEETKENNSLKPKKSSKILEHRLYPILIEYLSSSLNLYCMRIDEKRSKNSYGAGGNSWLHPDIVAMEVLDREWHELVRACVKNSNSQSVRLWSFEVKIILDSSNVRKSFFQAVSNSSWANEGYLVTTEISNSRVEKELRMLSSLHGIGVILLDRENPAESEIFLPAKSRMEIDWESVNRILIENSDFKDYIELVSTYYQTGRVRKKDWDRV
jgi:hypothetical protein